MFSMFRRSLILLALLQLVACAPWQYDRSGALADVKGASTPWASVSVGHRTSGVWKDFRFPGKSSSQFNYANEDGRDAMLAVANSSVSMWRQAVHVEPGELGSIRFSWKVADLIAGADMALREADDSPVRIVLAFDGDRGKFSAKNAMLSELARMLTGEELPYATMMYVWCNTCKRDSVIVNPRTDRVRKLVLESGARSLNRWMDYERVIREDFEKLFGEAPGALVSIALMTDTDNTKTATKAWYGPVNLVPYCTAKNAPVH